MFLYYIQYFMKKILIVLPVLLILTGCGLQRNTNNENDATSWEVAQQTWTRISSWDITQEIEKTGLNIQKDNSNDSNKAVWKITKQTTIEINSWDTHQDIKKTWFEIVSIDEFWYKYTNYDIWFSLKIPKKSDYVPWEYISYIWVQSWNIRKLYNKEKTNWFLSFDIYNIQNESEISDIVETRYKQWFQKINEEITREKLPPRENDTIIISVKSKGGILYGNKIRYSPTKKTLIIRNMWHDPMFLVYGIVLDWDVVDSFKFIK